MFCTKSRRAERYWQKTLLQMEEMESQIREEIRKGKSPCWVPVRSQDQEGDAGIAGRKLFPFCSVEAYRIIYSRISVVAFGLWQGL